MLNGGGAVRMKSRNQPEEQSAGQERGQRKLLDLGKLGEQLLLLAHRRTDALHAFAGVLDVGVQVAQNGAHRVPAAFGVVFLAQAHRDHGDQRSVGEGVLFDQIGAQRTGGHRQHDVVEGGVCGGLHRFDPFQRPRLRGNAPRTADPDVEHRLGRPEREGELLLEQGRARQGQRRRSKGRGRPEGSGQRLERRGTLAAVRLVLARSQRPGHPHLVVLGIAGEGALHQAQRRHPVHQRMVELGVDRIAPVVEPLHQMGFPERPVPIEQAAVQSRAQFQQFTDPAGTGQGGAAEVVVEFDVVVQRPGKVGDGADETPGVCGRWAGRRYSRSSTRSLGHEVVVGAVGWLEQLQTSDVHRDVRATRQEETLNRPVRSASWSPLFRFDAYVNLVCE